MSVMEVNRKGWTAWCMDITHMGLREAMEEEGGFIPFHNLTKDSNFLAMALFCNLSSREETSRGWVVLNRGV